MKAALLIPTYNKEPYIERCLNAALDQTVPCEILLFGPPSTDGTDRKILFTLDAALNEGFEFGGNSGRQKSNFLGTVVGDPPPMNIEVSGHTFRWLRPPEHAFAGMNAGVNLDFNWVMGETDADWCLFYSADDEAHPDRVKRTMEIAEEFNPSWIVCNQIFTREEEGSPQGETGFPDRYTRWISMLEGIQHQCGSSGGFAWARDLYMKYGPIQHIESNDVVLPIMALMERGMYYIHEPLMTMYLHDDLNNVGAEGQVRGARNGKEKAQLVENNNFQSTATWNGILERIVTYGHDKKMSVEAQNALNEKIIKAGYQWAKSRAVLTMDKIPPLQFGARALGMME